MNGILLLCDEPVAYQSELKKLDKILSMSFHNVLQLCIAGDNALFSRSELERALADGQDEHVRKAAIERFAQILKQCNFVLVRGAAGADMRELNLQIAKDLNIPVCGFYPNEIAARIGERAIAAAKALNFASVYEGKILFAADRSSSSSVNSKKSGLCGKNSARESGAKSHDEDSKLCGTIELDKVLADKSYFTDAANSTRCEILTPLKFESELYAKARANVKTVVLPESDDERILRAAAIIKQSGAANLILLGRQDEVQKNASELGLDLSGVKILDPQTDASLEKFARDLYELRKAKGMSETQARDLVRDRTYFGTMLVYEGLADAMVSGAGTTTAETIRPALQIIKTKPGIASVSGAFIMCLDTQALLFADCAVAPSPSAEYLAGIAISSAATAKAFGLEPRVAMLSYSSGDSGSGDSVEFIKTATQKAREKAPELLIDGPLQFDAAVDAAVAKKKMPNSAVAGRANVFIFPDLNCGNICYKAVQRTAGAIAIGPILQGLKKPINDLSRGCEVADVVNTILISAIQAGDN
ncbi:phosphate acetyltransferase [uncultured Campylobacter sp.]|uniref:phosphate acetyltransferase n=1 Tax=uncultured Campylobacter sp. TaxID=218934 RepID=UPI00260CD36A|nr:phosphate acetyltransferase [uncultured Campylobacter sp.]